MSEPVVTHSSRADFEATAAARAAIEVAQTVPFNLDVGYAVRVARAVPPRVAHLRDVLVQLYGFDVAHLDGMASLASALEYAQIVLDMRAKRVRDLPELAAEGYQLRSLLFTYCDLLALKGLVPAEQIAALREGTGYDDLVRDLNNLVYLFQEKPELLPAGAPVTAAEVARANTLARAMSDAMGNDAEVAISQGELGDARRKLAHLLIVSHKEVRRAVAYLRFHEGDAQTLVPSLYQRGPGRAKKEADPSLADLHDDLHGQAAAPAAVHPDDNPFTDEV
jgi:hypothetical protein